MSGFRFEAVRPLDGGVVRGRLEVASRPEALAVLERRGLLAVAVEPAPLERWRRRPDARSQATAFRSLASLMEAGVPLAFALKATRRAVSGQLAESLARVEAGVREGASLGAALSAEPFFFSPIAVGLVHASENGLGVASGLAAAADELERSAESAARMRAALAYPAILLTVGGSSLLGILLFVVPRFAALLADVDAVLPPLTRLLLGASMTLRSHWLVLATLFVLGAATVIRWSRSHRTRASSLLHAYPIIGAILHARATARAARALGALLGTGTPALRAIRIAQESVGDTLVAERLGRATERVAEGASLSAALEAERAFTPFALQMAAIGDGAGRLPELLGRAAAIEAQNAEQRIGTLIGLLEPALIVGFAAMVALVAAGLLQALYSVRPGGP